MLERAQGRAPTRHLPSTQPARPCVVTLYVCAVATGALLALPGMASAATVRADFNGDGRSDLAVGVPGEGVGSGFENVPVAGAVHVLYGAASGLSADGDQLWHQDRPGVLDTAEGYDEFGHQLAAGDFNGDGRSDFAVSVDEYFGLFVGGAVHVLYGGAAGLSANGDQLWHQDSPGVLGTADEDDGFGADLAAGDLDGDGRSDLAIGALGERVGNLEGAGAVNVLYGGASGLSADGDQLWHQNSPGVLEAAETSDFFGSALAAGDLNGDGRADLAVGSHERLGDAVLAGAVHVLYGGASGLSADGNQFWHQNSPGILDAAEDGDEFGGFPGTLAAGDLDADGRADLAVGVPFEDVGPETSAGAVSVLYGTASGLSASGNQFWHQNSPGALGSAEFRDAVRPRPGRRALRRRRPRRPRDRRARRERGERFLGRRRQRPLQRSLRALRQRRPALAPEQPRNPRHLRRLR